MYKSSQVSVVIFYLQHHLIFYKKTANIGNIIMFESQVNVTCRIVKFSRTLFIMYFSGKCLSLWIKLIMYSHMGERWIL